MNNLLPEVSPEERRDSRSVVVWIGVAGVVLAMLAGLFGTHSGSVWRLPAMLEARVQTALSAAGLPGLEVEMNGQEAVLRGVVATEGVIETARRAAVAAAGPGGPWAGGVTGVNTQGVQVGRMERPFSWRARRDGRVVTLSGAVPSDATRLALVGEARAAFPNSDVRDEMHVAGGALSAHWRDVARDAVQGLATLRTGEAQIDDENLYFGGTGTQQAIAMLRQRYQSPPPPFRVQVEVAPAP